MTAVRQEAAGPLLLGVRHHGPGSARAVRAVLEAYEPRCVLIEGPPEGDAVVGLAGDEAMVPPVALLAHAVNEPGRAAFWPLAEFSPEWVAIRWAVERGVPVRFVDLPAAHTLAMSEGEGEPQEEGGKTVPGGTDGGGAAGDTGSGADADGGVPQPGRSEEVRLDPLAALAEAAGYDDPERWWEDAVEHRPGHPTGGGGGAVEAAAEGDAGSGPGRYGAAGGGHGAAPDGPHSDAYGDPYEPFAALGEAMAALRAVHGDGGHHRDLVREAHMRLRLREARKEFGDAGVAVVCGAWHVPALAEAVTVTADRQALKGLPKVKTEVTWVPWTHRRLARQSGYGAGIASPGWYGHLFSAPDRPVERWLVKVAQLLREEDWSVSSAHVIEAVRLAGTLAAMRGRPLAGLTETTDAVRAVLCEGSDVPLELIRDKLVVGDVLGEVPEGAPAVPLQRDLARQQRAVRLKPAAAEREVDLDLRKETDTARSRLLHRLRLLDIGWGEPVRSRTASTGTFRESWRLCWDPELSVRVAEAGVWGTTVEAAATAKARSAATDRTDCTLADITTLAEQCLLANLPDALPVVMRVLADRAALESDVGHLAQALPSLVRTLRYGDVRGTDAGALAAVADGMAERICVGLPPACAGLDDDGARAMRTHLDAAHQAVQLLARDERDMTGDGADAGNGEGTGADGLVRADGAAGADGADGNDGGAANAGDAGNLGSTGAGGVPGGRWRVDAGLLGRWRGVLRTLAERDRIPGLLRGRCARLLLDDGQLTDDEAERLMSLVLSPGTPPGEAANWIEGFLTGGGMLLVHDGRLLALVDRWLTGVPQDAFTDVLPLLRRTFAEFEAGVRRTLGELVRRGAGAGPSSGTDTGDGLPGFGPGLDEQRAEAALETVRLLLGAPDGVGGMPDHRSPYSASRADTSPADTSRAATARNAGHGMEEAATRGAGHGGGQTVGRGAPRGTGRTATRSARDGGREAPPERGPEGEYEGEHGVREVHA
ncbi:MULTISPECIES: DUF5682 family protein [Streptomyces]|uniref:DUF5682 family protein n=1 Tax=Streptomyces TaxID=1883 RepID=UPI000526C85F|nr:MULTISPECIES: DUF5682 family protein [Streptomyces]